MRRDVVYSTRTRCPKLASASLNSVKCTSTTGPRPDITQHSSIAQLPAVYSYNQSGHLCSPFISLRSPWHINTTSTSSKDILNRGTTSKDKGNKATTIFRRHGVLSCCAHCDVPSSSAGYGNTTTTTRHSSTSTHQQMRHRGQGRGWRRGRFILSNPTHGRSPMRPKAPVATPRTL